MRLPCFARRWNSRKSGWIMRISSQFRPNPRDARGGIFDRQFSVHGKKRPIITLLRGGQDYSWEGDGILKGGRRCTNSKVPREILRSRWSFRTDTLRRV